MTAAPPRPSMSKARRLRIWERDKGVCYLCSVKVMASEAWDVEHKVAWALAYDDSDENLAVAHKAGCHEAKTKIDVTTIAKAKAQAGETGQWARRQKNGSQLKSRGFDKSQTRGFDGKVRARKNGESK